MMSNNCPLLIEGNMRNKWIITLLAVLCGWVLLAASTRAQLVERWRINIPSPEWTASSAKHGFDGEGNAYILRVDEVNTNYQRIYLSKISPDGDIVWSVDDIPYQETQHAFSSLSVDLAGNSYVFGCAYLNGDYQFRVPLIAKYSPAGQRLYTVVVEVFGHSGQWAGYGGTSVWPDGADSLGRIFCSGGDEYRESETMMRSYGDVITISPNGAKLSESVYNGGNPSNSFWFKRWEPFGPDMFGRYVVIFEQYVNGSSDTTVWHYVTYDADGNMVGSLVSPPTWASHDSWDVTYVHVFQSGNIYRYSDRNYRGFEKYSPDGALQWTKTYPVASYIRPENLYDQSVMIWENGDPDPLACYNADGSLRWRSSAPQPHFYQTDFGPEHDIYSMVSGGGALERIDYRTGELLWKVDADLGSVSDQVRRLRVDSHGVITWCGYDEMIQFIQEKRVTIRDARDDSIPNVEFELIRVKNNPPYFDEDTLGSFTTDSLGQLVLTPIAPDSFLVELDAQLDTVVVGDSLKIAKHVFSRPAVKHEQVLGTIYSMYLDNAQFADDGHMFFNTLTTGNQDIVLNHTELRYNLLVSVEWEATDDYLSSLEVNFQYMSDYLYDVTDGQVRLDTVYIFDNSAFSAEADVLVKASNMQWPQADVDGIASNGLSYLYLPRIWMGDSTLTRNFTDAVYPLDLVSPSKDYRSKAHEFGHYALGFYDEYLFWNPDSNLYSPNNNLRCLPTNVFRYGYMDYQYEGGGAMSSEMSNGFRYEMASCQNTNQYRVLGKSCWDYFETRIEPTLWGDYSLFVGILKPDAQDTLERVVSNPGVYFAGPNNDLNHLDYDVGILMVFPNAPTPQATGYTNKHITVHHSTGGDNADVQLWNDFGQGNQAVEIQQGRTSDASGAWVVGVKDASYQILAYKNNSQGTVTSGLQATSPGGVTTSWLYGLAESGGSGLSRVGNRYTANSAGDSLTIELNEVQGDYPLIFSVTLQDNSVGYDLTTLQPFPSDPTLQLVPSYHGVFEHALSSSPYGYTTTLSDSLGVSGTLMLWASDDAPSPFFVPCEYAMTPVRHDQSFVWLFGPEGQSEFKLDSSNATLTKAMILSSRYPVIRTGLGPDATQAGQTVSLALYPQATLAGNNEVVIHYDDADLKLGDMYIGDEATLGVYHWVNTMNGWQAIGGSVDTADNVIDATITESGVYAAFTSQIILDVYDNEYGSTLPYQFELSQNYPNPFNPTTTIDYSVPKTTQVIIEVFNVLGQKVRTLVNESKSAGSYRIEWNGTDEASNPVSTGVYLYRFQAGDVVQTKKMLLIK
jgi:hypothetical protein